MECVPHHLVATLPLEAYYSASQFRDDAMRIISGIMDRSDYAVVCGGSMMYVDALCNGIDELPTVPKAIREGLADEHSRKGDGWLVDELRRLDSEYAEKVDLKNIKRVFHAVEVSLAAGVPYSSLLTGCNRKCASGLPWKVVKLGIRVRLANSFRPHQPTSGRNGGEGACGGDTPCGASPPFEFA